MVMSNAEQLIMNGGTILLNKGKQPSGIAFLKATHDEID